MNLMERILHLFYPNVCGFCHKIDKSNLCYICKNRIKKLLLCKRKIYITRKGQYFDEHMYIFSYHGEIQKRLVQYKVGGQGYLAKMFASILIENRKIESYIKKYDEICPVPIHKKRKNKRGYNQSELILKEWKKVENEINIKYDRLIKIKNIQSQSKMNKENRKLNVIGAFKVYDTKKIKGKKILLFDDVYTTGSTVNECARILKEEGAEEVGVLTIAKD